jgi:hypothetical protein
VPAFDAKTKSSCPARPRANAHCFCRRKSATYLWTQWNAPDAFPCLGLRKLARERPLAPDVKNVAFYVAPLEPKKLSETKPCVDRGSQKRRVVILRAFFSCERFGCREQDFDFFV